jgi:hypothetical protein
VIARTTFGIELSFRIADKNEAAGAADASRGIILDGYAGVKIFSPLLWNDHKRS